MTSFPTDFAALLSDYGRKVLAGGSPPPCEPLADSRARIAPANELLDGAGAGALIAALDERLYSHLAPSHIRVSQTVEDGTAGWAPNMRARKADLARRGTTAYEQSAEIGLLHMLYSDTFHRLAEILSGHSLARRRLRCEIICYGTGDYISPHTDYSAAFPEGYVDLNLSFSNQAVAHQFLIYEKDGFLSEAVEIGRPISLLAMKLPLWHYVTPLISAERHDAEARRWMVYQSFRIE